MNYIELVKKRGYVLSFKNKEILEEDENKISEIIEEASKIYKQDITINYLKDGKGVYKKLLEFEDKYGKIIEAPQYLAFVTKDVKKGYEKTGYIGEWITFRLIKNNIDATWLKINDHDKCLYNKFQFQDGGYLVTLVGIGYARKESSVAKLIKNRYRNSIKQLTDMGYSDSMDMHIENDIIYQLNVREFVFKGMFGRKIKVDELENSGLRRVFQELHFAPTVIHKQLWRILMHEGKLFIVFIDEDKISKIEAGILKFYLEESLKNNGIKCDWHIIDDSLDINKYNFPIGSFISGYITY
jgi:hypothetical protein